MRLAAFIVLFIALVKTGESFSCLTAHDCIVVPYLLKYSLGIPIFPGHSKTTQIIYKRFTEETCRINPCLNGGKCVAGKLACVCSQGWMGRYCHSKFLTCSHIRMRGGSVSLYYLLPDLSPLALTAFSSSNCCWSRHLSVFYTSWNKRFSPKTGKFGSWSICTFRKVSRYL